MRLIDVDQAIASIADGMAEEGNYETDAEHILTFLNVCARNFAVDAKPVQHGRWIYDKDRSDLHVEPIFYCSACRNNEAWGYIECTRYCSYCGAKMDIQETENENAGRENT